MKGTLRGRDGEGAEYIEGLELNFLRSLIAPLFLVPRIGIDSILVYLGFKVMSLLLSISTSSEDEVLETVGGGTTDSNSSYVQE